MTIKSKIVLSPRDIEIGVSQDDGWILKSFKDTGSDVWSLRSVNIFTKEIARTVNVGRYFNTKRVTY